jgi:hypothetical protein
VYYMPHEFQNYNHKIKKTNLQLFTDCRSWWSKEPQQENDCGSFFTMFSTSDIDHTPFSAQVGEILLLSQIIIHTPLLRHPSHTHSPQVPSS